MAKQDINNVPSIETIIAWGLGAYAAISLFLFVFLTNNITIWRERSSNIPFGLTKGRQEKKHLEKPRRIYWVCRNPSHKGWTVMLHSWGRKSERMVTRAQPHWDRGYSLLFVDARSHGESEYTRITTGYHYAKDVIEIMKKERIERPILHGLSFGAIAATIIAREYPVKALILEATSATIRAIYWDFYHYLRIPKIFFGWIPWLLLKIDWPWDELAPKNSLKKQNIPIFLIHGEKDELFDPEKHAEAIWEKIKDKPHVFKWIVPNSPHSRMAKHPEYYTRVERFLEYVEKIEGEKTHFTLQSTDKTDTAS